MNIKLTFFRNQRYLLDKVNEPITHVRNFVVKSPITKQSENECECQIKKLDRTGISDERNMLHNMEYYFAIKNYKNIINRS